MTTTPEAPTNRGGRPYIGAKAEARLPQPLLDELDAYARENKLTRAEAMRLAVEWFLHPELEQQ
jgi:hypothetical protein